MLCAHPQCEGGGVGAEIVKYEITLIFPEEKEKVNKFSSKIPSSNIYDIKCIF